MVIVAVVAAGFGLVRLVTSLGDSPPAARSSAAAPTATFPAGPTPSGATWPTAADACGGDVYLPELSPDTVQEPTGVRLVVGGKPRVVDLDTGSTDALPGLGYDQFATDVAVKGATSYLVVQDCSSGLIGSVVAVTAGRANTVSSGTVTTLLSGGDRVYGVTWVDGLGAASAAQIDPLDGGPQVRLPDDFDPVGVFGGRVIGVQYPASTGEVQRPSGQVVSVDATTGARDGSAAPLTAGDTKGIVMHAPWLFSAGAECVLGGACSVYRFNLTTGERRLYSFTSPPDFAFSTQTVVSDDGTRLAFQRVSDTNPSGLVTDHPGNPQEIDVLRLGNDGVEVVGGVTLAPKTTAGLVFTADSTRLVVAVSEGSGTVLLVWREGMAQRVRWVVPGAIMDSPSVALDTS